MRFVKTEDIKIGQRLANPVYNKDGVLLYGRGATVNDNVLQHLIKFGKYGFYVLDSTEPLPVISEEEQEFEHFQTAACITLEKQLPRIIEGQSSPELEVLAKTIVNTYGNLSSKITFIQSLRGAEDSAYKHCLNVAMLCAMISNKLNLDNKEQFYLVESAFFHDIGKFIAPAEILNKPDKLTQQELTEIRNAEVKGFEIVKNSYHLSSGVKRYISQLRIDYTNKLPGVPKQEQALLLGTKILQVADMYDILTAMRVYKEPRSEFDAITFMQQKPDQYNEKIVDALIDSINILPPGCCVELTNGEKGLVLSESQYYPLRPTVLAFKTNVMYDLSQKKVYDTIKIKSVMKTLDNRFTMSTIKH